LFRELGAVERSEGESPYRGQIRSFVHEDRGVAKKFFGFLWTVGDRTRGEGSRTVLADKDGHAVSDFCSRDVDIVFREAGVGGEVRVGVWEGGCSVVEVLWEAGVPLPEGEPGW
jgi:hypothetical protein